MPDSHGEVRTPEAGSGSRCRMAQVLIRKHPILAHQKLHFFVIAVMFLSILRDPKQSKLADHGQMPKLKCWFWSCLQCSRWKLWGDLSCSQKSGCGNLSGTNGTWPCGWDEDQVFGRKCDNTVAQNRIWTSMGDPDREPSQPTASV